MHGWSSSSLKKKIIDTTIQNELCFNKTGVLVAFFFFFCQKIKIRRIMFYFLNSNHMPRILYMPSINHLTFVHRKILWLNIFLVIIKLRTSKFSPYLILIHFLVPTKNIYL